MKEVARLILYKAIVNNQLTDNTIPKSDSGSSKSEELDNKETEDHEATELVIDSKL